MAVSGLKLKPFRKTMAKSCKKLFSHIASADLRALTTNIDATLIFPPQDADVQAAITTLLDRLNYVLAL